MIFDKYEKNGAYHYAWYDDPNWAWYKECVDKCVKFCKGTTLDLGCGEGLLVDKIVHNGYAATGIELEQSGVDLADPELDIRQGNFESDGYLDTWEYICSLNVIEHLKSPDRLVDLVRNIATEGAIIITDVPTEHVGRYHEHEYSKKELLETFKEFKPKYFVINSTEHGKPIAFQGLEIKK